MAKDVPIRITTAQVSAGAELHSRELRYLISMGVRTVCFLGAVMVGPGPLRWVLLAGAVFLPYVAVVMANTRKGRAEDADLMTALGDHRELPPPDEPSRDS